MSRRTPRAGFTLLEMLMAMGLMAILAGSLYASLNTAFGARKVSERALEPARRVAAALTMIESDLAQSMRPNGVLAGLFTSEDAQGNQSYPADVLTFFVQARDQSGADPAWPILKVALSLNTDGTLVRSVTSNLLAPEADEPIEEVLCRDVRSFNVACYDGADWVDTWDSGAMGNVLPLAVQVTIVLDVDNRPAGYTFDEVYALPCGALPQEDTGATSGGGRGG